MSATAWRTLTMIAAAAPIPALYSQAAPRWSLVVEHRIGSDASAVTTFTDIRGIVAGVDGSVFVLDSKTQDIRLFDGGGRFVRRVAREGAGPGELRNANGMLARPAGGFVVNDPDNSRITVWSTRGDYERQIPSQSTYSAYVWQSGWDADGRIVERTQARAGRGPFSPVLRRISMAGGADTLPDPRCAPPSAPHVTVFIGDSGRGPGMMVPFLAIQRKYLDAAGNLWCSPGGEYRVLRYRAGASQPADSFSGAVAPEPIPTAERDSALAVVAAFTRRWGRGNVDLSLIPRTRAAVEGLTVDDRRVWVRRPGTPAAPTRFDVWSGGKRVATIESPLRLAREIPVTIVGDRFYAVALDDDDVQTVVVARITSGAR